MKVRFPASVRIVLAVLVLLPMAGVCRAGESEKPRCTAQTRGQLWPKAANTDPLALRSAAQSGTLEVCAPTTWRYRWQFMTIRAASPAADALKAQTEDRKGRGRETDSSE